MGAHATYQNTSLRQLRLKIRVHEQESYKVPRKTKQDKAGWTCSTSLFTKDAPEEDEELDLCWHAETRREPLLRRGKDTSTDTGTVAR